MRWDDIVHVLPFYYQSRVAPGGNYRVEQCFRAQALIRPQDQEGVRGGREVHRTRVFYDTCGV